MEILGSTNLIDDCNYSHFISALPNFPTTITSPSKNTTSYMNNMLKAFDLFKEMSHEQLDINLPDMEVLYILLQKMIKFTQSTTGYILKTDLNKDFYRIIVKEEAINSCLERLIIKNFKKLQKIQTPDLIKSNSLLEFTINISKVKHTGLELDNKLIKFQTRNSVVYLIGLIDPSQEIDNQLLTLILPVINIMKKIIEKKD